jgi:hypothetical protein
MPKRSSSESLEHEPDHRNMDQGFGMFSFGFVVSHQAAVFHKPAKGSLDDPAFGQHGKAALVFETWHHLQAQGARFAMRGHPSCEGRTGIGLVGPEAAQPAKPLERPTEELAGATLFGEIGRSNANPQQQTQGVHQNMAFAPLGFLAGIITARPRMVGGTDRLAVEDGGRGLGSSPGLAPDKSSEDFVNECPQPLASPATETAIDGFPRPELLGQQSPGTARSHQIKQAVKNAPPLDRSSASAFGFGQQWFKNSPLGVGQISWIRFVSHPSCSQNPLDKTCPRRILKRALRQQQQMKRLITSLLTVAVCSILCAGCSSLQPAPEQRAAASVRPWTGAPADPSYPAAESAASWLNWLK